jgi:hypothetical protein
MRTVLFPASNTQGIVVILALLLCASAAFAAELWTVENVLGGHSMKLVRGEESQLAVLHGVKAPKRETPEGDVAKQFLEELVEGTPVAVTVVRESRGMNYVAVELENGADPAAILLQYGLVEWDHILAPDKSDYAALEVEARENQLGLWGEPFPEAESEARTYVLRSDANGTREALISEDGTTILRMKGNEVPNYEVRARASQEKQRRAEERRAILEEQAKQREEAIRQQQIANAQAEAQARQDYLFNLEAQEQYLRNQNLYLNNQYWDRRLYGYYPYPYPHPYPYPRVYTHISSHSSSGSSSSSGSHGATHSPFLNVHGNRGTDDERDNP